MSFLAKWRAGEPVFGYWCNAPHILHVERIGHFGFDWLLVDLQHGGAEASDLVPITQALGRSETSLLVRVPWNEPAMIMRCLDAGATGVIVPMVNTAEDARTAVGACRYAPSGYRSWGYYRTPPGESHDPQMANESTICIVMVETVEAVDNIDDIVSTPGLDGVFIGRYDLALSAGLPPSAATDHPDQLARIERIIQACADHGVVCGMNAGKDSAHLLKRGVRMVTVTGDAALLNGAQAALTEAKSSASPG